MVIPRIVLSFCCQTCTCGLSVNIRKKSLGHRDSILSLVRCNRRGTKFIRNFPSFFLLTFFKFQFQPADSMIMQSTLEYCKHTQLLYGVMHPFYEKCIFSSTVFLLKCFILFKEAMLSKRKCSNIASESPHVEHAQIRGAVRKLINDYVISIAKCRLQPEKSKEL